jgi:hypothetical protein
MHADASRFTGRRIFVAALALCGIVELARSRWREQSVRAGRLSKSIGVESECEFSDVLISKDVAVSDSTPHAYEKFVQLDISPIDAYIEREHIKANRNWCAGPHNNSIAIPGGLAFERIGERLWNRSSHRSVCFTFNYFGLCTPYVLDFERKVYAACRSDVVDMSWEETVSGGFQISSFADAQRVAGDLRRLCGRVRRYFANSQATYDEYGLHNHCDELENADQYQISGVGRDALVDRRFRILMSGGIGGCAMGLFGAYGLASWRRRWPAWLFAVGGWLLFAAAGVLWWLTDFSWSWGWWP